MEGGVFVELKYCERCGGLWLRERGSGQVYCDRCLPVLDEWPAASSTVVRLPIGRRSVLEEDTGLEIDELDASAWLVPGGEA